jgi:hypothetical protein
MAEAVLGKAAAIMRGGVEQPDAAFPCGKQRLLGGVLVDQAEHVAERGTAESERSGRLEA